MKGIDFIRKIKKLAKQRELRCAVDKKRGKGSHVTLYFGNNRTIVRNPKDELKKGTIGAMLRQLELTNQDIQDI
ncbi:MAG: type II toxin-antitoxin system HicA family toxin [Proteobacteria bacterium]|nr:type II toxin-antitoxin system HicA family toxin [Pseudomonadota bacterium]